MWHRSQPPAGCGLPSLLESEAGSPAAAAPLLLPPPPRSALAAAPLLRTYPPTPLSTTLSPAHARREGSGRQRRGTTPPFWQAGTTASERPIRRGRCVCLTCPPANERGAWGRGGVVAGRRLRRWGGGGKEGGWQG